MGTVNPDLGYGILYLGYILVTILPGLTGEGIRLHDVGKRGGMILLGLILILGNISLLVLFLTESDPGNNKLGLNPNDVVPTDLYREIIIRICIS